MQSCSYGQRMLMTVNRLFTYSIGRVSKLIHKGLVSKMLYTETAADEMVTDG